MNKEHYTFSLANQLGKQEFSLLCQGFLHGLKLESVLDSGQNKDWRQFGLTEQIITKLNTLAQQQPYEAVAKLCEQDKIASVGIKEDGYPDLLRQIHDPPPVLYYRGTLPSPERTLVAVVGSRRASEYGKQMSEKIAGSLARAQAVVVSGLAFGIDACAHQGAVNLQQSTIAVLGSGVDQASAYPNYHLRLMHQILDNGGCVLSEYLPGTKPRKHFFVARNRIISGLSKAVVIIECRAKSGALITADFAIEQNRGVYALPGPITSSLSEGPNRLIQQGASIIVSAENLAAELGLPIELAREDTKLQPTTAIQQLVLQYLRNKPDQRCSIDELLSKISTDTGELNAELAALELQSTITRTGSIISLN